MRNKVEIEGFYLCPIAPSDLPVSGFDCGDDDLNEFFTQDVLDQQQKLLCVLYGMYDSQDKSRECLALLSLSNDSLSKKSLNKDKDVPYPSLPSVKIGRLGVRKELTGFGFGAMSLNLVKKMFRSDNRTGCRLITVDAYNRPDVLKFYKKNDFEPIRKGKETRATVAMYFDLLRVDA